jgi:hypothetical protein
MRSVVPPYFHGQGVPFTKSARYNNNYNNSNKQFFLQVRALQWLLPRVVDFHKFGDVLNLLRKDSVDYLRELMGANFALNPQNLTGM